ncbi:MAG: RsmE family RNA methyltransferase [bacterium]|nr:RsmE family RNA methyltransferase [bacterium]
MTIPRIFLSPNDICNSEVIIREKEDVHHISHVLRMRRNDKVVVLDNQGFEYEVILREFKKDEIRGFIEGQVFHPQPQIEIALVQGLLKVNKMDMVIKYSTELGVSRIIVVNTALSCVTGCSEARQKRWRRIIKEGSCLSGRVRLSDIFYISDLSHVLLDLKNDDLGLILYEQENTRNLRDVLNPYKACKKIFVFVGPEGGFTQSEVSMLHEKGVLSVSLGKRILSSEVASISALTIILYQLNLLG